MNIIRWYRYFECFFLNEKLLDRFTRPPKLSYSLLLVVNQTFLFSYIYKIFNEFSSTIKLNKRSFRLSETILSHQPNAYTKTFLFEALSLPGSQICQVGKLGEVGRRERRMNDFGRRERKRMHARLARYLWELKSISGRVHNRVVNCQLHPFSLSGRNANTQFACELVNIYASCCCCCCCISVRTQVASNFFFLLSFAERSIEFFAKTQVHAGMFQLVRCVVNFFFLFFLLRQLNCFKIWCLLIATLCVVQIFFYGGSACCIVMHLNNSKCLLIQRCRTAKLKDNKKKNVRVPLVSFSDEHTIRLLYALESSSDICTRENFAMTQKTKSSLISVIPRILAK